MTRTVLLVALLLIDVIPGRAQQPPSETTADTLLEQAMRLHQAGDIIGAIDGYKAVLQADPSRTDARSNLGAAYAKLGRYSEAIEQYQSALQLEPANATFRFNLGLAYYKAYRLSDAIPALQAVIEGQSDNKAALLLLGDALLQTGEDQRVIDLLTPRDAEFATDNAFGYLVGMAFLHTGHRDKAQIYLDRIFKAGESAEGHLLMGTALFEAANYRAAVDDLRRAVELNPQLPTARSRYAQALLAVGDHDTAVSELQRALQANPNDFDANLQLGSIRRHDQQNEDALVYVQRAMRLRPQDRAARFNFAAVQLALGKPEDARVLFERLVADEPTYEVGHVMLATCYYRLKRKDDGDRERAIAQRLRDERQQREEAKPGSDVRTGPPEQASPP